MRQLLIGLGTYMKSTFPEFVGSYLSGNTTEWGPFFNIAPESTGNKGPDFPYMTIQVFGQNSDLGFINPSTPTTYVEKPRVRFLVWDTSNNRALKNIETLCSTLDRLSNLDLNDGQYVVSILRTQNAQTVQQPIYKTGQRAFMWFVDYDFRNVRTLGS